MSAFEQSRYLSTPQKQLPVSSYFDPNIFQAEQRMLFANSPQFVGHASFVPEPGCYYALPHEQEGRVLIRQADGNLVLMSNVCRHRQAVMLKGQGKLPMSGAIVCPLHKWTYDSAGQLIGAPEFVQNPCLHLKQYPLQEWNGLLFTGGVSPASLLANVQAASKLDFSDYALGHIEQHHCAYNWKTFMEVYLEDYHVVPSHPGLGRFVDCSNLTWEFGEHFSVQTVGIQASLSRAGTPAYQAWQNALDSNTTQAKQGAIWLSLYPTLMVEWYPNVLTVSVLYLQGPESTLNTVAFFYPQDVLDFEPELCQAQRAAYMETAIEDDDFALRMDAGRKALWLRGENEVGPYQNPLEDGMEHFHDWYRRQMHTVS